MRTVEPDTEGGSILSTNNIDLSQFGSVGVGLEATAYMAMATISNSMGGGMLW